VDVVGLVVVGDVEVGLSVGAVEVGLDVGGEVVGGVVGVSVGLSVVGAMLVGESVGKSVGAREVGDAVGAFVGQAGHITGGGGEHTGHDGHEGGGVDLSQHGRQASCGSRPLARFSKALRDLFSREIAPTCGKQPRYMETP
jgi:hypothetical protein